MSSSSVPMGTARPNEAKSQCGPQQHGSETEARGHAPPSGDLWGTPSDMAGAAYHHYANVRRNRQAERPNEDSKAQ
jgi:hypothetical protein